MKAALLLSLFVLAPKIEPPRVELPKLDIALPEVPDASGLVATAREASLDSQTGSELSPATAAAPRVVSVQIARDFVPSPAGLRAVGALDAFVVPAFPARLSFQTSVRLVSPDRMPARLKVQIKTPGGIELASASRAVTFDKDEAEVVLRWDSVTVRQEGDHRVVVSLDGVLAAEQPLGVKAPSR